MIKEFSIGLRQNEEWRFAVALSMSFEGMGASLFLVASILNSFTAAVAGLALVGAGVFVLFVDLGHPLRFWRVISRAPSAWISQGALFITGLLVFGVLGLVFRQTPHFRVVFEVASWLCASAVMLYPGLLLGGMSAVPWWQRANLPVALFVHALTSGIQLLLVISVWSGDGSWVAPKGLSVALTLLILVLFLTWSQVRISSGPPAVRESLRMLTKGDHRGLFLGGAVLAGMVAPIPLIVAAFIIYGRSGAAAIALMAAATLVRLAGDVSYRYAVLQAGVRESVL
jgi:formate-dependent nitrite reductase membrane component NrfD